MKYIETIKNINDLKKLNIKELDILSEEIRKFLIDKISNVGGHLASNLGIIELTIALHYVFDENDKFIFDGSHQTYTHKIITGRYKNFKKFKENKKVTGLSNYRESTHDVFSVGHTSTSIALGCGLVIGRNINKSKEKIISIIGDGSLSGSEAFSSLNNAGTLTGQFLIIINDNEQSIASNYGGLYSHLKELRESNGKSKNNIFKNFGLEYQYIENGNDIKTLIREITKIKDYNKPLVLHVHTKKGYGYPISQKNLEKYHFVDPFNIETGEFLYDDVKDSYKRFISNYLINKVEKEKNIMVINSGIPTILDLGEFRKKHKDNYIDTGICEDYSISLAAGLSKQNMIPVVMHMSSFSQRMFDQLSQDICINDLPIVLIIEGAGISGSDETHSGLFDITLFSNIPNFIYLEPKDINELKLMLDYAIKAKKPIGIRVPFMKQNICKYKPQPIKEFKYEVLEKGKDIAILAVGSYFSIGEELYNIFKKENKNVTLINPRFINIIDEKLLLDLKKDHKIIITIENSTISGGFGEKIDRYFSKDKIKVFNYAYDNKFYDREDIKQLKNKYHLNSELIYKDVINYYE